MVIIPILVHTFRIVRMLRRTVAVRSRIRAILVLRSSTGSYTVTTTGLNVVLE